MEYEEIGLLKQSEKSTVHLVREKGGEQVFVRKILAGQHPIYQVLQNYPHPCLPKLYEVIASSDLTTIIEEYIEAQPPGMGELSEGQFRHVVRELCSVLEFLHGKGIIHRDIKPSNILLTEDGHVYLIDFDAARMPKAEREQDTVLLGTRGFAPPEQYGFAQTDERTDIYALGATLDCLLQDKGWKLRYKKVIQKCMNVDSDKRYQSVRQVRSAFFHTGRNILRISAVLVLLVCIGSCTVWLSVPHDGWASENADAGGAFTVLRPPGNPHWDGETAIAVWENVPEAGVGDELLFCWRLYRRNNETPPVPDDSDWYSEGTARIGGGFQSMETINWSFVKQLERNGFYYFTVSALGDGVNYADSSFVVSDAFAYTGESAPPLLSPIGLEWKEYEMDDSRKYCATWGNLDDYEDKDRFNVTVYDETGAYVMNNTWSKEQIVEKGFGGILIREGFLVRKQGRAYRFTVQVYSSRPNEYSSSPMPEPVPEEYFSPWLYYGPRK